MGLKQQIRSRFTSLTKTGSKQRRLLRYLFAGIIPTSVPIKNRYLRNYCEAKVISNNAAQEIKVGFDIRRTLRDTIFLVLMRLMTSSWIQEEMEYPLMRTISSPTYRSSQGLMKWTCSQSNCQTGPLLPITNAINFH